MPSRPDDESLLVFGAELRRWRELRGVSLRGLARLVNYSPGHVSKVEHGAKPPTPELAQACDKVLDAGGELADLAPTRSVSPTRLLRPAQLPAGAAGSFVGRDGYLLSLDALLTNDRDTVVMAAVDGPPGAGKTALALQWAHHAADNFPDGQLYTDLRGYSPDGLPAKPEDVLEEFLVSFGVSASNIPSGAEQRAAMFRSVLAERRVLVVLDNAADSEQVRSLLPGSAGSGVVVTSRKRLSGLVVRAGARRVTLGPMPSQESVTLLRRVIRAERADAEPDAVEALAQRCGHLPLALRVAAERVVSRPHHAVADLVDELAAEGERLDLLAADDDANLAVRAVFSWSYQDLEPAVARMFRLLGLHPGVEISTEAAGALAGYPVPRVRRWLEALTSVHLIEEIGRDRYRLHDLLRDYAAERVRVEDTADDRMAAVRRLTDWYLHTAFGTHGALFPTRPLFMSLHPPAEGVTPLEFPDADTARAWCESELGSVVPVTRMAIQHQLYDTAWKLPVVLWTFFSTRRPWSVWMTSHRLAVDAAVQCGDRFGEAWALNNLAKPGPIEVHRSDEEVAALTRAMEIRQEIDDRPGLAWTTANVGYAARDRGQFEPAAEHFAAALPLFVEVGDRVGEVSMLTSLGEVYVQLGRLDEAMPYLDQAADRVGELDDPWIEGYAFVHYAEAHRESGAPQQALECLERALIAFRGAADRWSEADALERRGEVLHETGRVEDARTSFHEAMALFDELDDPRVSEVRMRLRQLG